MFNAFFGRIEMPRQKKEVMEKINKVLDSKWCSAIYDKFDKDMTKAGFKVQEYHGRFFYKGPAVSCSKEEFQSVLSATKVKLIWDDLGLGHIVYPK